MSNNQSTETLEDNGSFFVVFSGRAVELEFKVGNSGLNEFDFAAVSTKKEEFVKGLVALIVEEADDGNLQAASKIAGLIADYYERDVVVLDAQLNHTDTLVGEIHFIDGDTFEERHQKAQEILDGCLRPGTTKFLH